MQQAIYEVEFWEGWLLNLVAEFNEAGQLHWTLTNGLKWGGVAGVLVEQGKSVHIALEHSTLGCDWVKWNVITQIRSSKFELGRMIWWFWAELSSTVDTTTLSLISGIKKEGNLRGSARLFFKVQLSQQMKTFEHKTQCLIESKWEMVQSISLLKGLIIT